MEMKLPIKTSVVVEVIKKPKPKEKGVENENKQIKTN